MTGNEKEATKSTDKQLWWGRIPDLWKALGVIVAIAATAIGGYAMLDDVRDDFEQRVSAIETSMVKRDDLAPYVIDEALRLESCIQRMRARMHEYRAVGTAYEELLLAMKLEEDVFLNRELKQFERERRDRIVELRSKFEKRKFDIDKEWKILEALIANRKC